MPLKKKKTWIESVVINLWKIRDNKVIIGCSGGPDSMVLLDIIRATIQPSQIIVAHVNHDLRPTALRDEQIVQKYCEKYHLTLEIISPDIKKAAKKTKTTIEECARNIRRVFFESLRKKYEAEIIITAHHADDQSETILYRITKWTALTGLVGIEEQAGHYFRPLLSVTKQELLEYAHEFRVPFGHDETNDDVSVPRNLLRHNVLPELQKINPEVTAALNRLSHSGQELKMSFDAFFTEVAEKKSFSLDWYNTLPIGFQHELLRFIYELTNGSTHGLSTALIGELDRFLSTRNGGKKEIKKMKLEKKQGNILISQK